MQQTQKLTKRIVDAIKPDGTDRKVFDGQIPGFHLRVKPSGAKSYALKYRIGHRQRTITIGRHGILTPEQARNEAYKLLADVAVGGDPSGTRQAVFEQPKVKDLWDQYLVRHALPRKAPRSIEEDKCLWRKYLEPAFGHMSVDAITQSDVIRLHNSMQTMPWRANHARCLISKMMNLAIDWGYRSDNPCRGVEKFPETPRNRFLSTDERHRLTQALSEEADHTAAIAIWMLRLTGARKGEVLQARWEQFDLEAKIPFWQIPAGSTKQKRVNRKPLSRTAFELLMNWEPRCPRSSAGWVIPGRDPENCRYDLKRPWDRIRKRADLMDVRLHDLRHDFASIAVANGTSLEIIGRYLGHSSIQTTQRYAHLQDDPLHAMAEQIGQTIETSGRDQ